MALANGFRASVIALAALGAVSPAYAGSEKKSDLLTKPQISEHATNQQLLLQADELVTDSKNDRVIAKGNVEVYYKNYALQADELVYDRKARTLDAVGRVRIKEPDGAVINADRITLTEDFRDGFIRSFQAVTKDEARIAAANAYRKDGNTTVFERSVFTPCKPCGDNPDSAPIWRIRAAKITHKKDEGNVYMENGVFEAFGVPIAWVPYFYYPDPTVKHRSGFLGPQGRFDTANLGTTFAIPYYYTFSPSMDLTLTPEVTSKAGTMVTANWRQRLKDGAYKIDMVGAYDDTPNDPSFSKFRGSIVTKGDFEISSFWKWGWDVTVETDDTFRRYYKLDDIYATDRMQKVYLTGQSGRNYFEADLYHFGGLTVEDTNQSRSLVLPSIDYNYIFGSPILGGELAYDANVLALSRDKDGNVAHVVNQLKWRRTITDPLGELFTPFGQVRGDLYSTSNFIDPFTNAAHEDTTAFRGNAVAGIEYRYPFVKHTETATHVIEPIGQVIARPNIKDQGKIPNEDAQSLVYDDTLLFDIDKFSGYDRIETGTRANVGVRYSIDTRSGLNARFVAGQSFQLAGENPFSEDSGLNHAQSDYVTGVYLDLLRNVQFVAQTRFDQDTLSVKREDLSITGNYGPFTAGVTYVNAKPQPSLGFSETRQEVAGVLSIKLAEHWTLFGDIRYDLEKDYVIRDSVGLKYADECFMLSVAYVETNISDGAIQPDKTWLIRYDILQTGSPKSRTDNIGAFTAETVTTK